MLTQNDYTTENSLTAFESCKHTSAKLWGAKRQGIFHEELLQLFAAMKAAGKQTVLEVVAYDEASRCGAREMTCVRNWAESGPSPINTGL